MQDNKLSPRLLWIAERVRNNILLYDVGTDHAKLPAYLLDNNQITAAIASDIHKGPLEKAKVFVDMCGYSEKIELRLADGLCGIKLKFPCDIAICGMGGETIVNILKVADAVKNSDVRLLLQPMTDFTCLRAYLTENGFSIIDEDIVFSDDREYQCIIAEFVGKKTLLSAVELEVGALCIKRRTPVFLGYIERKIKTLNACIVGKRKAGLDTTAEDSLLCDYQKILEGRI